jgi:transposase InsO family protein
MQTRSKTKQNKPKPLTKEEQKEKEFEEEVNKVVSLMTDKESNPPPKKRREQPTEEKMIKKLAVRIITPPKKDEGANQPHIYVYGKNQVHQMDLLQLPNDKNYQYLLVVIDIGSRKIDAHELKQKTASSVKNALIKIYERGILKKPKVIEVDAGSEFKGVFKSYVLNDLKVKLKVAKAGRHSQVSIVERANLTLGKHIFHQQILKELRTQKTSKEWLKHLDSIIKNINSKVKPRDWKLVPASAEGDSQNLLEKGTKVLVKAEFPRTIEQTKLMGKMRGTDYRFELKPRVIKDIIIKDFNPPLYLVGTEENDGYEGVAFTRNQLLLLTDKEYEFMKKFK